MAHFHLPKAAGYKINELQRLLSFAVVAGFVVVIGLASLLISHAAAPSTDFEAESASLGSPASLVSDSSASNGQAIKFGAAGSSASAPTAPPAVICDNAQLNGGPANAPTGAITVPAGDNSSVNFNQTGKTFWFAPGTHTFGSSQYGQVIAAANATYIGAPGAVLDGKNLNKYAFTGQATGVTIEYLTIQNFGLSIGDNNNEGVVNHDAGHNWTIKYNTVQSNGGAGVFVGSNDTISYNCLRNNGQYGFSAYEPNGISNVTLDHNEISGNDTYDWEAKVSGCGCTGGGKFWDTHGAIITNNYVHDNHSTGIWADTNNSGFDIEGNYIANNYGEGVWYEISYNALIKNNTFIKNAIGAGPNNPGFPTGAIYLSESGSDSRVSGNYGSTLSIIGNVFTDNWSGVILWENADRFCNSPANTSGGYCTLVNPSVATLVSCNSTNIATTPYINDCRWKTQNVSVTNNSFNFTAANVGSGCSASTGCGYNGIFSNYGTYPSWSPYTAYYIADRITSNQNNHFSNNTYHGAWSFMIHDQATKPSWTAWRAAPYNQDNGSSMQ